MAGKRSHFGKKLGLGEKKRGKQPENALVIGRLEIRQGGRC